MTLEHRLSLSLLLQQLFTSRFGILCSTLSVLREGGFGGFLGSPATVVKEVAEQGGGPLSEETAFDEKRVAEARRIARSSAWAVGSPVASRSLAATARTSPPLATTAPTGTSPFSAACSAASKARRIIGMSVSEGSYVSGAGTKTMIAVCPLLWTEPGWDPTPGFASSPSIRARISSRTVRNARR